MSASLKVILHTKKYTDGTQAVMLQCIVTSASGNIWKRRTLCKVKTEFFDKGSGRITKKQPNHIYLNAIISAAYNEAEKRKLKAETEGRKLDPEQIISAGAETSSRAGSLLAQGRAYVERCAQKGQFHTAEKYEGHVNKLAEYLGRDKEGNQKDIHMDDVDEAWLLKWSVWLKSHGTKSANTLHRRMAFIGTLFNDARRRQLTKSDPMAFLEFKEQRVRKPKLSLDQLATLEAMELSGRQDDARNTFLLQFFAYGSRISDALSWQKENIWKEGEVWYLHYTSMKTGDLIDVRLNERARALVAWYLDTVPGPFLLPWLSGFVKLPGLTDQQNNERLIKQIESKTQMVNLKLKEIAKKAGIKENLTTHIARHTFATLADSKVTDKRKISAALGHAKFSTTEVYLAELRQSDVNDAMEDVWK